MSQAAPIEVRPARRRDSARLAGFLSTAPRGPGVGESADSPLGGDLRDRVVAVRGDEILGTCRCTPGAGRCAVVSPPRLAAWDEPLAARLCRAAAARACRRHGVRLIQSLTEPDAAGPLAPVLEQAGFERLAVLAYMRRSVGPEDRDLELAAGLAWPHYSLLRHRKFARTIAATYQDSLDCPRLAGLRSVDDAIATHRHTGTFAPHAWRLALEAGQPVGVSLVNNLQGRGELVYLGVVPAARGRGMGRTLLARAIRDTAGMGLPSMGLAVDVANAPAMHLYEEAGFREIRRRLAYFIPRETLETLVE